MQYYPPVCGYPIGGPSNPYNNFAAAACGRVVGEGDVTSVPLPDGGVQLYFVPARVPPAFYPFYNATQTWNAYPEAWFVRSVPIAFPTCQPNAFNQQAQRVISDPAFQQMNAENKSSFHLKFHNDGWTSTTDIHCFYPALRCHNWFPKQSVAIQAHAPPCSPEQPICSKPCLCSGSGRIRSRRVHKKVTCACKEPNAASTCAIKSAEGESTNSDDSNMSIECENCIDEIDKQLSHKKLKPVSKKVGKKDHECECPPVKLSRACATVTERATSVEVARETQAGCAPCEPAAPVRHVSSFILNNVEVDFWYPKTPYSKRDMKTKESQGSCNCGCASDSEASNN